MADQEAQSMTEQPSATAEQAAPSPEQSTAEGHPAAAQPGADARAAHPEVPTEEDVYEALEEVIAPELGLDFVSLGLVYDVAIEQEDVYVTFPLTNPACPIGPQ